MYLDFVLLNSYSACLNFPEKVVLEGGETFTGEEILLIGLRRLNYPCKLITLVLKLVLNATLFQLLD